MAVGVGFYVLSLDGKRLGLGCRSSLVRSVGTVEVFVFLEAYAAVVLGRLVTVGDPERAVSTGLDEGSVVLVAVYVAVIIGSVGVQTILTPNTIL